jgi:hypothetical protein
VSAQTPQVVRDSAGIVGYYVILEVVVSTGDTFKVQQLASISGVAALKIADWSTVTCTSVGNVVTVTQAGLSGARIVAVVGGQK